MDVPIKEMITVNHIHLHNGLSSLAAQHINPSSTNQQVVK